MESLQHQSSPQPRRNLPPAEIDCKWWKKGNCTRGSTCFFRHEPAQLGVDSADRKREASSPQKPSEQGKKVAVEDSRGAAQVTGTQCAICFEVPNSYGLLINCDHVFCLECIRSWRTSAKNTSENGPLDPMGDNNSLKKTSKTCPMCRVQSDYVVPSSVFPVSLPSDAKGSPNTAGMSAGAGGKQKPRNPAKDEIVNTYLSRLKKIPCRYFENSVQRQRDGVRNARLTCGFGNNCHYAHINPTTQEPYVFSAAELNAMKAGRAQKQRRAREMMVEREMAMIVNEFGPMSLEDPSETDDDEFDPEVMDELYMDSFSEFFGPSPFFYAMMNQHHHDHISDEDTEWETESE